MSENKIKCPKCQTELYFDDFDEILTYHNKEDTTEGYFCHNCESYVRILYDLTPVEIWIEG